MCYLKNTIEASLHPHPEVSAYSVSEYKSLAFFLSVSLRCNRHTALYKFKLPNLIT